MDTTSRLRTILVIDDTPDNLALMSRLLKDRYKVKIANSGQRGLTIAAADPQPDLILLDVMMPEMDGYEVCRRLKADPATRDIPIVFLTARFEECGDRRLPHTCGDLLVIGAGDHAYPESGGVDVHSWNVSHGGISSLGRHPRGCALLRGA